LCTACFSVKTSLWRFILVRLLGLFSAALRELQNTSSGGGHGGYAHLTRYNVLQRAYTSPKFAASVEDALRACINGECKKKM
jgi:hypothetical protein